MLFETRLGNHTISIIFESDAHPCLLKIENTGIGITLVEDVFPNAKMASAQLRDTLGWIDAKTVLNDLYLSPNSQLWDLNHDRPFALLPVMSIDDLDDRIRAAIGDSYDIIGETIWCDYEEGEATYLLEHRSSKRLSTISAGSSVYKSNYVTEIEITTYSAWLELCADNEKEI